MRAGGLRSLGPSCRPFSSRGPGQDGQGEACTGRGLAGRASPSLRPPRFSGENRTFQPLSLALMPGSLMNAGSLCAPGGCPRAPTPPPTLSIQAAEREPRPSRLECALALPLASPLPCDLSRSALALPLPQALGALSWGRGSEADTYWP